MTDEPDPAGTDRDRRARLRVVGDDRDDVRDDDGDEDRDEDRDEDKARADDPSPEDSSGAGYFDGETTRSPDDGDEADVQEWAWVAEWRESGEPVPWATGLPLAAFAALLAAVAIWVLSAGLADRPILAVLLNLLVAGGLVPAMWLSRNLPVLRWFAAGAAVGVVGGWVAALMML